MADEQIKIKIQADAEQFKAVSAAVEKALSDIGKTADITRGKLDQASKAVKGANQQWTSLALVVQDLPYGFRAIQNNLPALAGSLASVTGPAYLAFSALIAVMTVFDQQLQKTNKVAEESYKKFYDVKTEVSSLAGIFSAVRAGTLSASDATKIYNDKLGDLFGKAKSVYEAEQLYVAKTEAYVRAQFFRAKADIELEKAKEALAKKDKATTEDQVGVFGRLATAAAAFVKSGALPGIAGFWKAGTIYAKDAADQQIELAGYETQKQEAEFQKRLAQANIYQNEAFAIEQKYGIKSTTLKDEKTKRLIQDKSYLEALKAKQTYYKDDILLSRDYSIKVINEEERLAIEEAKYYNASREKLLNISQEYLYKRLAISQEFDKKEAKRNEDSVKANIEFESKIYRDSNAIYDKNQKELTAKQVYFSNQRIKQTQSEADQTIKANKGNYQAQRDALEQAIAKLTVFMSTTNLSAAAVLNYQEAITGLIGKLDGLVDPLEAFNTSLTNIINDTLGSAFINLGEQIGQSLFSGDGIQVAIDGFLNILATGLIEVGKLAISTGIALLGIKKALEELNPYVAIAAGVALVALGSYVKGRLSQTADTIGGGATAPKKFANGGIISGPTYGLMGEYPGAKSNPEVVAPLSKLKDMMDGGGNGQFVLRGNDLVLALNRSNYSLNLRRG